MIKKKKTKEFVKDVGMLTGLSIGLPLGAKVATAAGGSAAPITTLSTALPIAGKALPIGYGLGILSGVSKDLETNSFGLSQTSEIGVKKHKKKEETMI